MSNLLVIVPTRGRPQNVARLLDAWKRTDPNEIVDFRFAVDIDDPQYDEYARIAGSLLCPAVEWMPMVPKLNRIAILPESTLYEFMGFMGDDHLPETVGWGERYVSTLIKLGVGIVYPNDRYRGRALPTSWAMTTNIVTALNRMVPAPVDHLCCDDAILQLGLRTGTIRYFPDVIVEHAHPLIGRAAWDAQYRAVNNEDQLKRDSAAYGQWMADGLERDAATVLALRGGG